MPSSHPHTPSIANAAARLAAAGLACQRGERRLFRGLDLVVEAGQIVWVRGANGRGKTSLLRLLSGLSTPADGTISWLGQRLGGETGPAFRQQLVYIAHANGLKDDLTAIEALRFLARIHGRPAEPADLEAALQTLGIANRRHAPVRTLSQGQRRRVALARLALDLAGPGGGLWLLDEPYDALDSDGITIVDGLLSAQARRGGSVVLTSHLPLGVRDPAPIVLQLDQLSVSPRQRAAA